MTQDIPPDMRRRGVLLVLIRMMGQRATPERLDQLMEVVPEEAVAKRIARPEEATFRGLYLVNAAERRIAGQRTIGQETAYRRPHPGRHRPQPGPGGPQGRREALGRAAQLEGGSRRAHDPRLPGARRQELLRPLAARRHAARGQTFSLPLCGR